ncbi:hypothetical protein M5K25_006391 [Dendrobium thyrsiflorum]|uniref:Uncharacterized protein n=1 Tax=Dendrobium thyrsiflorum TaxID=117978 RepID=A0ABD0VIN9_DENTH
MEAPGMGPRTGLQRRRFLRSYHFAEMLLNILYGKETNINVMDLYMTYNNYTQNQLDEYQLKNLLKWRPFQGLQNLCDLPFLMSLNQSNVHDSSFAAFVRWLLVFCSFLVIPVLWLRYSCACNYLLVRRSNKIGNLLCRSSYGICGLIYWIS